MELVDACREGDFKSLETLLKDGADVNVQDEFGRTGLHMACANARVRCVALLIKHKAKLLSNDMGSTPVHWAVVNKRKWIVKLLLQSYDDEIDVLAKPDGKGAKNLLDTALGAGDTEIFGMLLKHKSASPLDEIGKKLEKDSERFVDHEFRFPEPGSGQGDVSGESKEARSDVHSSQGSQKSGEDNTSSQVKQSNDGGQKDGSGKEGAGSTDSLGPVVTVRELAVTENPFEEVLDEQKGTDRTGLALWAASIVCARFCLQNAQLFEGKTVLELGSGCGMTGLTVAAYCHPKQVILTDFFEETLDNLKGNLARNKSLKNCEVRRLDWTDPSTFEDLEVDVVIGADLIYGEEAVMPLLQVLGAVLRKKERAFLYTCRQGERGGADKFLQAVPSLETQWPGRKGKKTRVFPKTHSVAKIPKPFREPCVVSEDPEAFGAFFPELVDASVEYQMSVYST